jgi:alcohol dehydrogenase
VPWLSCYGLGGASGDWGGAVSDLVGVPYADAMLVVLPDGISPEDAAAASCNIPDAYRCVGPQLLERPGAPVLVIGGAFGNIGLYSVAIAKALGASRVDYLDGDEARASRAATLGADVIPAAADVEAGAYPITVDASQDPDLLALALRATAGSGVCTASTMYLADAPLPLLDMFRRCVTFQTGQPHARTHLEPVLELIRDGRLRPAEITDAVVGWEDAPAAFASGGGKTVCVRPHHRGGTDVPA